METLQAILPKKDNEDSSVVTAAGQNTGTEASRNISKDEEDPADSEAFKGLPIEERNLQPVNSLGRVPV